MKILNMNMYICVKIIMDSIYNILQLYSEKASPFLSNRSV